MTDVRCKRNLLVIMVIFMLTACTGLNGAGRSGSGGVYHRVKKGETLAKIAHAYKIDIHSLARANKMREIEVVEAGRALFIPDARRVIEDMSFVKAPEEAKKNPQKPLRPPQEHLRKDEAVKPPLSAEAAKIKPVVKDNPTPKKKLAVERDMGTTPDLRLLPPSALSDKADKTIFPLKLPPAPLPEVNKYAKPAPVAEPGESRKEGKPYLWPVSGKVVTRFGVQRNGMFNNGIKILAVENAPVIAAAAGTVIYSAFLKDYGETIIIKHPDDYATVYAHLGRRLVKCDVQLKRGEKIALLTRTEAKGEPLLHFEIRYKNKARNPLLFLP